jgi:hypothetical protein
VPPIETFTNSTPSAPYLSHSGMPGRNTWGASIRAASVIAAGSVIREPASGTRARPSQAQRDFGAHRRQPRQHAQQARAASSTGREAAITMTTNTNRGSV